MQWRGRASKKVVEAVVAAFCDSAEECHQRLSELDRSAWQRSLHWLDASGMALYFLDRVESLHIEDALPSQTLARLRGNLADNRDRSATLFAEFAFLNQSFHAAGLLYANLKGFTLSPDSSPRPELRCQLDFDFLIDGTQLDRCRTLLSKTGYELAAATPEVWELKSCPADVVSIQDHYKARPQRCIELHFASSDKPPHLPFRDPRLERLASHAWGGLTFPALMPADQFIAQALHVFKHLCSSSTRLSWLLEYQHHVAVRSKDEAFWEVVRQRSATHRYASIAIGLTTMLAHGIFGGEAPPQLEQWTTARLPAGVRLWAEQYGRESILADFPGTKLFLLLQQELQGRDGSWKQTKRRSLLPLHRAPRIVRVRSDDSLQQRIRSEIYQLRFVLFRLRFHVIEGLHYLVEAFRWKRRLAALRQLEPDLIVE